MKFGQSIEYNMRNIFFKNHTENDRGRLNPDLFFFVFSFLVGTFVLIYFVRPRVGDTIKKL